MGLSSDCYHKEPNELSHGYKGRNGPVLCELADGGMLHGHSVPSLAKKADFGGFCVGAFLFQFPLSVECYCFFLLPLICQKEEKYKILKGRYYFFKCIHQKNFNI